MYIHLFRFKNTRQAIVDLMVGNSMYKSTAKFKYVSCTITDTNTREDEIEISISTKIPTHC